MFCFFTKKKGETLPETLIAIFIISFSIVSAITLVVASLKTNNASKERIIAINMAREGIEAMHFIRDTNWLHYSRMRRVCWNNNPSSGECVDTTPEDKVSDNAIQAGMYRIDFDPQTYVWSLSNTPDPSDWENNKLYLENGLYTHRADLGGVDNQKTDFRRRILIKYLKDDGTDGATSDNRMEVISDVIFIEGNRQNHVTLVTHLSDYYGRDYTDFPTY